MQVTVADIVNSTGALRYLMQESLPARLSFRLATLMSHVTTIVERFERERIRLLERYAYRAKGENGAYSFVRNDGTVDSGNAEMFQKELGELLDETVAIPIEPISVDDLDRAGVKIPPVDLFRLRWLIVDNSTSELPQDQDRWNGHS